MATYHQWNHQNLKYKQEYLGKSLRSHRRSFQINSLNLLRISCCWRWGFFFFFQIYSWFKPELKKNADQNWPLSRWKNIPGVPKALNRPLVCFKVGFIVFKGKCCAWRHLLKAQGFQTVNGLFQYLCFSIGGFPLLVLSFIKGKI